MELRLYFGRCQVCLNQSISRLLPMIIYHLHRKGTRTLCLYRSSHFIRNKNFMTFTNAYVHRGGCMPLHWQEQGFKNPIGSRTTSSTALVRPYTTTHCDFRMLFGTSWLYVRSWRILASQSEPSPIWLNRSANCGLWEVDWPGGV